MIESKKLAYDIFRLSSIPGINRTAKNGEMKRYYLEVNPELLNNAKQIAEAIAGCKITNASLLRNSLKFFISSIKLTQEGASND